MKQLSELSDRELCEIFRHHALTHDEWGIPRIDFLHEFNRRGESVLDAIGWPRENESVYCNRHTGRLQTYSRIVDYHLDVIHRPSDTRDFWIYTLLEHWEPYSGDPKMQAAYLPKGTQLSLI